MPMIFNPFLEFGFEEKDDIRILMKDSEGNEIDITDYVANLNQEVAKKVNIFQGSSAGNKVMATDAQGNVTNVAGVVMNQSEREKLAAMTNPMLLKGIVESYEALYQIANPQVGWIYLVPFLENGENIHKEYVYTDNNRWELLGNFNLNMIQHYYSGTATEIDNAHNVNILFNPDTFEVDSNNRLNIKDFSYVRKCTQQSEINAVEIGSIFHWQGVDNQSIIVEDTNGNQTYIQYGFFYKKEADKIVLVNKEPVKDSLAVDVNVSTWSEFVTAVQNSATIATRIHFISNITVSSSETLDLSNCIIYGHYKEWDVADYEITIRGNYANFNNLLFRGASVINESLPLFTIVGVAAKSCNFIFDNCRFHNFLELGDAIVIHVNSASSSTIHLILHSCTITGENVNTYARVLHINNGGNGYGVQLKVMQLITTNSAYESKKIGIVGAEKTADAYYSDGSAEYASLYIPSRFVQWGVPKQLSVVNNEVKYTLSDGETQLTLVQKSELSGFVLKSGDTISGTLILSRTQDASGTANNKPALIIGGTDTQAHLEIDANEIIAKASGTTGTKLWLQDGNGDIGFKGTDYSVLNPDKFRAAIGAGTSDLAIGTTGSTAAAGNHTHALTIATDSGTNQLTLAASTKYKLTAGGKTFIFTTPANGAPSVTRASSSLGSGGYTLAKYGKVCTLRLAAGISGTYTLPSDIPKPDSTLVSVTNGQHIKITQTQIIITSGYAEGESITYISQ